MCGICGSVNTDFKTEFDEARMRRMLESLKHRGPDESNFYRESSLGLGIARLKIIDLETGSQPIFNEDKTIVVVFNGEIVNFIELRKDLEAKGHCFYTRSDTEVIVHLYETYGTDCLKYLNGMFVFALWDKKNQVLMLAKDQVGIKPLYYFYDKERFIFSSELRSLIANTNTGLDMDLEALTDYFTFMFIPAPKTIYSQIKKLPAGHYLVWKAGVLEKFCYYNPVKPRGNDRGEKFYLESLDGLLRDAVKLWLRSDVPLGLFLSGGIDSTLLAQYLIREAKQLDTFTGVFEEKEYDESKFARETAAGLGAKHHEIRINEISLESIRGITEHFDEPFADFSSIPFYLLSRQAKKNITVVISGDGGDEIFGGYPTYIATRLVPYYKKMPALIREKLLPFIADRIPVSKAPVSFDYKLKRFIEHAEGPWPNMHIFWQGAFNYKDYSKLYDGDIWEQVRNKEPYKDLLVHFEDTRDWPILERLLYVDRKTILTDDYLVKVDRMSMAHSLEVRPLFLDQKILEFMHSVPDRYKIRGLTTKWILRRLLQKINPKQKFNAAKRGFSPPMSIWLKTKLRPLCEELLSIENLNKEKIFQAAYVRGLVAEHMNGKKNNARKLWCLIAFFIWRRKYGCQH